MWTANTFNGRLGIICNRNGRRPGFGASFCPQCARSVDTAKRAPIFPLVAVEHRRYFTLIHHGTPEDQLLQTSRKPNILLQETRAGERPGGRTARRREVAPKIEERSCGQPPKRRRRRVIIGATKLDDNNGILFQLAELQKMDPTARGGCGRNVDDRVVVRHTRLLPAPCHRVRVPQVGLCAAASD